MWNSNNLKLKNAFFLNNNFIQLAFLNFIIVAILVFSIYLFLPNKWQETFSTVLFIFSAIIGIILGTLFAKIINLKKKIIKDREKEEKRFENIQIYMANVVHDLRSPVASINMISELLEDDLENLTPQQKELLGSITKSSATMLERICCILDNTKYEKGIVLNNINSANPWNLIVETIKKHEILAIEKNITIQNQLPEDLPCVSFDPEALDSVLSNLISNAIKYSLPDTTISIFHEVCKGAITFYIKDQGLGMTSDDLKKVFGEFTKLSARPTAGENSSGLGLSIVKKLVEKMGGKVNATSEGKGKGSTFSFSLKTALMSKSYTA
jgi:signal transduction histidine kinase